MSSTLLGLVDLVAKLRAEIESAQKRLEKQNQTPMFVLKQVEAEIHFVVQKVVKGGGGLEFHFLAVEAKGEYKTENVHKLKVVLAPSADVVFAGAARSRRVR